MLYATVRNRKIHVKKPDTVVQNGVKVDWLQLEMDDEWAEMDSIVCVFVARYTEEQTGDGGTKTLVEQEIKKEMLHTFGQKVLVPWEVLVNSGMLSVSCTGYVGSEKIMTTMYPDSFWQIVQNGPKSGDSSIEPTPSLYDQILAASGAANAAAIAATQAREQLLQDKANGVFDGADGKAATVEVGTVITGSPEENAQVYATGTPQERRLNFVIPRGKQGPKGEVNPSEIAQAVENYMAAHPIQETDPTVPAWAKQPEKPTYTAEEVHALPDTYTPPVDAALSDISTNPVQNKVVAAKLSEVESIAKGRATGYVFKTEANMRAWIAANASVLNLGDNLYILATDVPDYWWDGISAQPLETQKVDLTEYAKKSEVPAVDTTLAQSGQAADAAKVGARLSSLSAEIADAKTEVTFDRDTGNLQIGDTTIGGAVTWNYADGMPEDNGLTYTGTEGKSVMQSDGLLLSVGAEYKPTVLTASKATVECVFSIKSFATGQYGFLVQLSNGTKGILISCYNSQLRFNNNTNNNLTLAELSTDTDYTLKIEWDETSGATVYLNGGSVLTGGNTVYTLAENRIAQTKGGTTLLKSMEFSFDGSGNAEIKSINGAKVAAGKSAYAYAVEGGYTGTEAEFAAKLAQEKYANPEALTFTGAATGSYDGSQPITVNIPSGGGAEASETWEQIATADISAPVRGLSINQDSDGNPFLLKKWRLTGTVTGYSNAETAAAVQASVAVTQEDDSTVQAYAIFRPSKSTVNNAFSVGADDGMIYSICNSGTSQNVISSRLYGITTKVFLPIKKITINGISASNLYVGSFTLYGVRG